MNTELGAVSYVFTVSNFFSIFIPLPIEPASCQQVPFSKKVFNLDAFLILYQTSLLFW